MADSKPRWDSKTILRPCLGEIETGEVYEAPPDLNPPPPPTRISPELLAAFHAKINGISDQPVDEEKGLWAKFKKVPWCLWIASIAVGVFLSGAIIVIILMTVNIIPDAQPHTGSLPQVEYILGPRGVAMPVMATAAVPGASGAAVNPLSTGKPVYTILPSVKNHAPRADVSTLISTIPTPSSVLKSRITSATARVPTTFTTLASRRPTVTRTA
ncbi:uncharacterized protein N7459_006406 [Penicillium hispanicum]|uniref:uncharacterized protein n=1 Tax=Penicillium hispanicum TaxID=1080232 RepID=UPI002541C1D9|nr:uncharacterized protein N7459_006406 [Penicillium hispanicum]KAJ5577442.1 hypothetical protein N7459_006406 [Penicillium hispanicum]